MATEKFSATVDEALLREVRARAGPRGLSAFVNTALRNELSRSMLRELLDELAAEIGPPDASMLTEAETMLDQLLGETRQAS